MNDFKNESSNDHTSLLLTVFDGSQSHVHIKARKAGKYGLTLCQNEEKIENSNQQGASPYVSNKIHAS